MCDSPEMNARLDRIIALLDRRGFKDTTCSVEDTQSSLILDYQGYHYLYLWSPSAITLKLHDMGTVAVSANTWTDLSFRPNTKLFTTGQATPVLVVLRATDEPLPGATQPVSGTVTALQGTSPWVGQITNVNANGANTGANSSPVVTATDDANFAVLRAETVDSILGGLSIEQFIQAQIMAGKAFATTTGVLSSATNPNLVCGAGIFNNSTAKKFLIYSIRIGVVAANFATQLNLTTVDPAFGTALTPVALPPNASVSVASCSSSTNGFTTSNTPTGTVFDVPGGVTAANTWVELLTNNTVIYLPNGAANGLAVYTKMVTAGNSFAISFKHLEL